MTRLSKQARRRAVSPRRRTNKCRMQQHTPVATHLPFKTHENALFSNSSVFIPKIIH